MAERWFERVAALNLKEYVELGLVEGRVVEVDETEAVAGDQSAVVELQHRKALDQSAEDNLVMLAAVDTVVLWHSISCSFSLRYWTYLVAD
jgi:hypothetical protein